MPPLVLTPEQRPGWTRYDLVVQGLTDMVHVWYVARVAVDEDHLPVAVGPAVATHADSWRHPDDWEVVSTWPR